MNILRRYSQYLLFQFSTTKLRCAAITVKRPYALSLSSASPRKGDPKLVWGLCKFESFRISLYVAWGTFFSSKRSQDLDEANIPQTGQQSCYSVCNELLHLICASPHRTVELFRDWGRKSWMIRNTEISSGGI